MKKIGTIIIAITAISFFAACSEDSTNEATQEVATVTTPDETWAGEWHIYVMGEATEGHSKVVIEEGKIVYFVNAYGTWAPLWSGAFDEKASMLKTIYVESNPETSSMTPTSPVEVSYQDGVLTVKDGLSPVEFARL